MLVFYQRHDEMILADYSHFILIDIFLDISRLDFPRISNVEDNIEELLNWKDMIGIFYSFHKFPH